MGNDVEHGPIIKVGFKNNLMINNELVSMGSSSKIFFFGSDNNIIGII
jgi:hypothetical protein